MSEPIFEKRTMWYKSKFQAFPGKLVITEEKFSFHKAPKWAMMFGALGALLGANAKGVPLVDDEIKNLTFSKGRSVGKKRYMLVVTDSSGKSFDFLFDDKLFEPIKEVIKLEEPVGTQDS